MGNEILEIKPEEIKKLRDRLGLSQPKFARLLGIEGASETLRRRIMRWESGERRPDSMYVIRMYKIKKGLKALADDPSKLMDAISQTKEPKDD